MAVRSSHREGCTAGESEDGLNKIDLRAMIFERKYDRVVGGYEGTITNRDDDLLEQNVGAHRLAWLAGRVKSERKLNFRRRSV